MYAFLNGFIEEVEMLKVNRCMDGCNVIRKSQLGLTQ